MPNRIHNTITIKPPTNHWPHHLYPTLKTSFSLCQRIDYILEKLNEEPWLPDRLRDSTRRASAQILTAHLEGKLSHTYARKLVGTMAIDASSHDELTLDSRTLQQIRTLDLELNDRLRERMAAYNQTK